MPTIHLQLSKPHDAQQRVIDSSKRFNVVACGRRWGKTELGKNRIITPETAGQPVAWFSPTYKMLIEVWRDVVRTLQPITLRRNATERRIELLGGGVVEFWSLDNADVARGRKYSRVIVDEAAMVPTLIDVWQYIIRPTLADTAGDGWFLSTPKGRNGFWQMYQWGMDEQIDEWAAWTMPTTANPYIADSEVEAMRQTMPERAYQQEMEALFLDDAGGVFRRVQEAATAEPQDTAVSGHQYVIGVDWAQQYDFTVITVVDATAQALVYLDRFNQVDYNVQRARLLAVCERFKPSQVIAETNSIGLPNIDALMRDDIPIQGFTTTNATKAEAVDALALAFERGDIQILDDPTLIAELQAFEMTKTATGLRRFSAPEGMHDDCVMSLALAWQGAKNTGPLALFSL